MELAEDLDELTQSSDSHTDDIESPASGYRHAAMLIQKLDNTTLGTHWPPSPKHLALDPLTV
jgi:hypothetical protein